MDGYRTYVRGGTFANAGLLTRKSEDDGIKREAHKEMKKEVQMSIGKLDDIVAQSDNVLFRAKSVFPFDLFPDELIVTVNKIDVVYNDLFNRRLQPVYFQNISDVYVDNGILFSNLTIVDTGFIRNLVEFKYLRNRDALEALRIIQGLVVSMKQRVDITKIDSTPDFVRKIKSVGSVKMT